MDDNKIKILTADAIVMGVLSGRDPLQIIDDSLILLIDCENDRRKIRDKCFEYLKNIQQKHRFSIKT